MIQKLEGILRLSRIELQNGSTSDQKLQSQTKTEIRCWNCNGIGHLQFNCQDQNRKYNKYKPGSVSKDKSGKLDSYTKLKWKKPARLVI